MMPLTAYLMNLAERGTCLRIKIPPILLNPSPLFKKGATNHSSAALACASQMPK